MAENSKECGTDESTTCRIYNDTGNPMRYLNSQVWNGNNIQFPQEIPVRKWITFSPVKGSDGSVAAVVYRGKNGNETVDSDHLMAWSNPWSNKGQNSVWAETGDKDNFTPAKLEIIHGLLAQSRDSYSATWNRCKSEIKTDNAISAEVAASFTVLS